MKFVRRALVALCLVLLAALIATPSLQIVMRGVFNVPMAGAEELARYFLISLTLMGAAYVTHSGGQIRMEEFAAMLPARGRFGLQVFIDLCSVMMFGLITAASVISIGQNLDNQTATLEMPYWLFMAPLTLGMALLTLEYVLQLRRTLRQGRASDKQTTLA
ncbi:MAG: TRAP transporter small permease [Comamonadaceae bacterium]|jgi:TRAP-type C4-dicarboxylate transport system permease small subunit|nr:TRAP transporter small permease [Comamonadaceae bacterium]